MLGTSTFQITFLMIIPSIKHRVRNNKFTKRARLNETRNDVSGNYVFTCKQSSSSSSSSSNSSSSSSIIVKCKHISLS